MIFELAEDFSEALLAMPIDHPKRRTLDLFDEAIRREIQFIARRPTTLFQCMWNLCWWYDCRDVESHYALSDHERPEPPPGTNTSEPKLHQILETWKQFRESQATDSFWLRSVRPPRLHLGTAQYMVIHRNSRFCNAIYSPDGSLIATADFRITIWDVKSGAERLQIRCEQHQSPNDIAFSPDGRHIISGGYDRAVSVWDVETGREIIKLEGHLQEIYGVAYSPDGTRIASASVDRTVRIWNTESGSEIRRLTEFSGAVRCVSFSPDGTQLASGSESSDDSSVIVWDTQTGERIYSFEAFKTTRVSFSPNGAHLAVASYGGISVWDLVTGNRVFEVVNQKTPFWGIAYLMDGSRIASGSTIGLVQEWDAKTGQEIRCLRGHHDEVRSVTYSPDGKHLTSASEDGYVRVWNARGGDTLRPIRDHTDLITCMSASPDFKRVVTGSYDQTIRIWDRHTGITLRELGSHNYDLRTLFFSTDGSILVSESNDYGTRVWDTQTWSELFRRDDIEYLVKNAARSPNGNAIALGAEDGTVRLWDYHTGEDRLCLKGHKSFINYVDWSPDGSRIVSASYDKSVRVWNALTGEEQLALRVHRNELSIRLASFVHGTNYVFAQGLLRIRVWDLQSGEERYQCDKYKQVARRVTLASNGHGLLLESQDGLIHHWNWETGECTVLSGIEHLEDDPVLAAPHLAFKSSHTGLAALDERSGHNVAFANVPVHGNSARLDGGSWAGMEKMHFYLYALEGPDRLKELMK